MADKNKSDNKNSEKSAQTDRNNPERNRSDNKNSDSAYKTDSRNDSRDSSASAGDKSSATYGSSENQKQGRRDQDTDNKSIDRQAVDSQDFRSVGYDEDRRMLETEDSRGGIYRHSDVPPELYREFVDSEYTGDYYNSNIKDKYKSRKMEKA